MRPNPLFRVLLSAKMEMDGQHRDLAMSSTDLVQRLKAAFKRVEHFPEDSKTGFINLISLRNLVPEAIREIESLRAKQPDQKARQTDVGRDP